MKHAIAALLLITVVCCQKRPDTLTVLTTTDLHGWVLSWDYARDIEDPRYGLERAATVIDSIRRIHPHALLVDAGDWLQGNAFADHFAKVAPDSPDYPLLRVADHLGYDAFVLGNHEFNYGLEYLRRRIQASRTPIIAANVYVHGTDSTAYPPYVMKTVRGVKVAIVGITTPGTMVWDRRHVEGRIEVRDGVTEAAKWVRIVRDAGAEVVIVLAHTGLDGNPSYDVTGVGAENVGEAILSSIPEVDLLVFGHSHRVTTRPDAIQAGRWGSHLGEATLHLSYGDDGRARVDSVSTTAWPVVARTPAPRIRGLVEAEHEAVRSRLNEPLTPIIGEWNADRARLEDSPMVDLIHSVQLEVTGAELSAASAFNTNAVFSGPYLSRRDLSAIYPYENMLYVVRVTGRQIRDYLEHSSRYYLVGTIPGEVTINPQWPGFNFDTLEGLDYGLDLTREPGRRLTHLRRNGRPIRDADSFTLAVNSYRAEGGGGFRMLTGSEVVWRSDRSVRELMEEWVVRHDTLRAEQFVSGNWRLR
jgi:2',3'-cyclic-nucleotide 2'-phosphodiesterase (5'-nucleotidase family)